MDIEDFRKRGKEMVDYICHYLSTIEKRRVIPDVEPGYMRDVLPPRAPKKGEDFSTIMQDVEKCIMPGVTHWQHPHFHAYFPAGNAFPSVLGDMLSSAIGCVGFSWAACPAATELELVVLDWLAKMMGLPEHFLHESGVGGGVLQGSASDCVLVSMLAARHNALKQLKLQYPFVEEATLMAKLVAYSSQLVHSCIEKASVIACVKMRQLDVDDNYSLQGCTLQRAIDEDRKLGLIPFFVCATIGTTACCSVDNIAEMGAVCEREKLWLHVDAAYAGASLVCPEFQFLLNGFEHATTFNTNPNKWLLMNFDCSVLWVRDRKLLTDSMIVNPLYLQHHHSHKAIDFRHWGIPLSRRFRSLKLWFVIRSYGVEGLQKYIRNHIRLAKLFESLVRADKRFELIGKVMFGLVCFRLRGPNAMTQCLMRTVNESARIHMTPALVNDTYVMRFCVTAEHAVDADIYYAWDVIREYAHEIIKTRDKFMRRASSRVLLTRENTVAAQTSILQEDHESEDEAARVAPGANRSGDQPPQPPPRRTVTIANGDTEEDSQLTDTEKPPNDTDLASTDENVAEKPGDFDVYSEPEMIKNDEEDMDEADESDNDEDVFDADLTQEIQEQPSAEAELDKPFICEEDLGIGSPCAHSVVRKRRNMLIRMISDPRSQNRIQLKSFCFCSSHAKLDRRGSMPPIRQLRCMNVGGSANGANCCGEKVTSPRARCKTENTCSNGREEQLNSN